ncbi:hypothetical protein WJX73_008699 [Symbiochloris irregularis]|uniref:Uncharacterized protein n=1 Tax=Symbiochloris irregularis TaxID=706552 RepID=A0AAW1PVM2_9CHLO
MDSVVQLVNRLQSVATKLGDNAATAKDGGLPSLWDLLPSIVVIGGQSSGKSSVLEAVVGRDFLPRGTGIVTRRPLVMQLVHLEDPAAREYGEFLHNNRQKLYDFAQIRDEIEAETNRFLAGKGRAVAPDPIQLTIYSPSVPNLTLVDMPGLTKVPIDGQPRSIVKELDDMARTYIKGDNAIILAVTPANADLATSDALHMAREVDPAGDRTIGVLTKLDIMDPGTDARDILEGSAVKLKHGWIGVVNRGQKDINQKVPMGEARSRELEFFRGNSSYRDLKNIGTGFLSVKLSNHLIGAIRKQLPVITHSINEGIVNLEKELESMGGSQVATRGGMLHLVLQLCRQFEDAFAKCVDGGKNGGEVILTVFERRLTDNIRALDFHKILDPSNVRRIVEEADGYQPHLIAPEMGYRRLLQECLILFKGPAEIAVDEVHAILRKIVALTLQSDDCKGMVQFTHLQRDIARVASEALDVMRLDAKKMVATMVEMERSYLTAEVFKEILQADGRQEGHGGELIRTLSGRQVNDYIDEGTPADRHLRKIAIHVSAYITHVRTQLKQTIPKAIVHTLVLQSKKKLLEKLHAEVANSDDAQLKRILSEDEGTLKRRDQLLGRLKLLKSASEEIATVSFV